MGSFKPRSVFVYCPNSIKSDLREKLFQIAQAGDLPLIEQLPPNEHNDSFFLTFDNDRLTLIEDPDRSFSFFLDYLLPKIERRRQTGRQNLARAVGAKDRPLVLDATAGLGHDAILLASQGCSVIAIEQLPVLWALASDALTRAQALQSDRPHWSQQVKFLLGNSLNLMETLVPKPDVIYLDPMFIFPRKKTSLPKKEIQMLRTLLGPTPIHDSELFELALKTARKRVVVKRSTSVGSLGNKRPNYSIEGNLIRFDVYTI